MNTIKRATAFAKTLQATLPYLIKRLTTFYKVQRELRTCHSELAFIAYKRTNKHSIKANANDQQLPINPLQSRLRQAREVSLEQAIKQSDQFLSLIIVPQTRTSKSVTFWS